MILVCSPVPTNIMLEYSANKMNPSLPFLLQLYMYRESTDGD